MKKFLGILVLVIVINCTSQFSWAAEISTAVIEQQTIGDNETLTVTSSGTVYADIDDLIDAQSASSPTLINNNKIINGEDGTEDNDAQDTVNFSSSSNGTITNTGTIRSMFDNTILVNSTSGLSIDNSGSIEANRKRAITGTKKTVSNITITNSGTIKAETGASTIFLQQLATGTITNSGTISSTSRKVLNLAGSDSLTITNSGTISAASRSIWLSKASNVTLTNESGGTISSTDATYGSIYACCDEGNINNVISDGYETNINIINEGTVTATGNNADAITLDINNSTITNRGTLTGSSSGTAYDIEIISDTTGTRIIIDKSPTFTLGTIDLNETATTIELTCTIKKDLTLTIIAAQSVTYDNKLCGNDTYTITTSGNNDTLTIDGNDLEVETGNSKYKSELVLTKLRGLLNAANYIDENASEDKFVKVFYNTQKRENIYSGDMHGIVGQLSPIEWGPITSNIFLGYTKQNGDFDAGSFLGGSNYALGLKNTYEKNGIKASLNPMIGFQSVSITDYDIEAKTFAFNDLLSEFMGLQGNVKKEINISDDSSLNLKVKSTYGVQKFPDYVANFLDGDVSVDDSIDQVLGGGFEVEYNEDLGNEFIIKPYVGFQYNNLKNQTYGINAAGDRKDVSTAATDASGYYAGFALSKDTKLFNLDLNVGFGNTGGLIDQFTSFSLTKSFGKDVLKKASVKKVSTTPKIEISDNTQEYSKELIEIKEIRKLAEKLMLENKKLQTENEKLRMFSEKVATESKASKKLIVALLKENEKVKLEKQIFKNKILENENKELLEQLEGSNAGNKPSRIFLLIFGTILGIGVLGSVKLVTLSTAWIYNRMIASKSS